MNEVLMAISEHFWTLAGLVVLVIISIVAIKITFSIDINRLLERRDKNNGSKFINACPHFQFIKFEGAGFEVRSLFYKPAGTFMHKCRQCGVVVALDMEQHERQANYFIKKSSRFD